LGDLNHSFVANKIFGKHFAALISIIVDHAT